jgi:hypothetical protein
MENMSFFPNIKPHLSPSAFACWHASRSSYIKSYFENGEKYDSYAMKAGKQIHALIEAGLLKVIHNYAIREKQLTVPIGNDILALGTPDSYEVFEVKNETEQIYENYVRFVDYKSGKENGWEDAVLYGDQKMRFTSWLVWKHTDRPKKIYGSIEYIPTQWNAKTHEIEPTGEDSSIVAEFVYTYNEMVAFSETMMKAVKDINAEYDKWLESADFVDRENVREYVELYEQNEKIEARMEELKELIGGQLDIGGKLTFVDEAGSFYFNTKKKFEYPTGLRVNYKDYGITIEDAEEIAKFASSAKKNFEVANDPISVSKTLAFRPKKKKIKK